MKMPKLESAGFGWLVADGQRYDHDLIVTTDGRIQRRPKHLSKKYGGWHTVLGPEEVERALAGNPAVLLIGCGHFGQLPIRPETYALLAARGTGVEKARIPHVIKRYEELVQEGRRVAVILHLTC